MPCLCTPHQGCLQNTLALAGDWALDCEGYIAHYDALRGLVSGPFAVLSCTASLLSFASAGRIGAGLSLLGKSVKHTELLVANTCAPVKKDLRLYILLSAAPAVASYSASTSRSQLYKCRVMSDIVHVVD